jgi:hypothetical protein
MHAHSLRVASSNHTAWPDKDPFIVRFILHLIGNTKCEVVLFKEIPYNIPHVFNQRSVLSEKAAFPNGVRP